MVARILRASLRSALAPTLLSVLTSVLTAGCLAEADLDDEAVADEAGDESTDSDAMELGANLLKNGGFQSGMSYWLDFEDLGGVVKRVTGAGTYLRTKDPSVAARAFVVQGLNVKPGKKYHFLVKAVRRSGSGVQQFGVSFYGEEGLRKDKFVGAGTSKSWHWISFNSTAPEWAHEANVWIGGFENGSSTFDWDGAEMRAY